MSRFLALVAELVLLCSQVAAQPAEEILIQRRKPTKGDITDVSVRGSRNTRTQLFDPDGKLLFKQEVTAEGETLYRQTILEGREEVPVRLRREYGKAQGKLNGKEEVAPYAGKTVIIELKDGIYRFMLDGEELSAKQAPSLHSEFNSPGNTPTVPRFWASVLPKTPVKLKQHWAVDTTTFVPTLEKMLQMRFETAKIKAEGQLLDIRKEDNRMFGNIELLIQLPLKSAVIGGVTVEWKPGSTVCQKVESDRCIDGTSPTSAQRTSLSMDVEGTVIRDGKPAGKVVVNAKEMTEEKHRQRQ